MSRSPYNYRQLWVARLDTNLYVIHSKKKLRRTNETTPQCSLNIDSTLSTHKLFLYPMPYKNRIGLAYNGTVW